ncbi:hypothetical protein ACH40E_18940 [Streptomyces acidicola]|uniref:hypothetical protein n=1 Tax=Streptomyces acidicola TaxID=2596892 RepID=UPI003797918C
MRLRIAELCESVLLALVRILLPSQGRHRAATAQPPDDEGTLSITASPPVQHRVDDIWPFESDTDTDTDPVRPYLLTPEELHERRLRRRRRRALWLATYGIDVGPRRIHGVEVAA